MFLNPGIGHQETKTGSASCPNSCVDFCVHILSPLPQPLGSPCAKCAQNAINVHMCSTKRALIAKCHQHLKTKFKMTCRSEFPPNPINPETKALTNENKSSFLNLSKTHSKTFLGLTMVFPCFPRCVEIVVHWNFGHRTRSDKISWFDLSKVHLSSGCTDLKTRSKTRCTPFTYNHLPKIHENGVSCSSTCVLRHGISHTHDVSFTCFLECSYG